MGPSASGFERAFDRVKNQLPRAILRHLHAAEELRAAALLREGQPACVVRRSCLARPCVLFSSASSYVGFDRQSRNKLHRHSGVSTVLLLLGSRQEILRKPGPTFRLVAEWLPGDRLSAGIEHAQIALIYTRAC